MKINDIPYLQFLITVLLIFSPIIIEYQSFILSHLILKFVQLIINFYY